MIKVSVYRNDELVTEFEQPGHDKEITIGRAAGCSIQLDEPSVSRLHALLQFTGNSWVVVRKANFGAVLLNGQEIENAPIEGGEELIIGAFSLRVNIEERSSRTGSASRPMSSMSHNDDDEGGGTKIMTTGVNGLFRFEPGTANLSEFLMQNDLAVFGRGSNCDVVLTEKKASRKHLEIRKQGLSFILKDLNSANGTLVNGKTITETELVSGDLIEIGEAKIQFSVENKNFFSQQDQFLPVPAHLEQAMMAGDVSAQGGIPDYGGADPGLGIPGIDAAAPAQEAPKSLVGKVKLWYSSMPKERRMRIIGLLTAIALLGAIFGSGEDAPKRPTGKAGPGGRTYERLTAEKKKYVRDNYAELLKSHEKRDYQKVTDYARNILTYVDDYNDTKSYEMLAKKGIEQAEEEKRRKILEEKQAAVRKEVAALEEKGRALLAKALDDPKFRPELETLIQEIYSKDPNNRAAVDWKNQIKAKDDEEKRLAEEAKQKEEIKAQAEVAFGEVEKMFKEEKYIPALAQAETLYDLRYKEQAFLDRIEKLKDEIRTKLSTIISPYMREAETQRQEGGDLVKAKEAYLQVLKVDATNKEAKKGLEDIRDTLHLRAKRLYTEAILADSMSDLVEAREKYEKCLRVAPDEKDIYRQRCRSKLSRFEAFTPESSSTGSGQ
ncbi:MAG: FHA domain-containing protein [Bacteriovoracia bacterium]